MKTYNAMIKGPEREKNWLMLKALEMFLIFADG